MIKLLSQSTVAILLLAGWGFWIWIGTGRRSLAKRGWWIWCLLGGVAVHTLVLQQLWYLGLRVSMTSWVSAVLAVVGLGGWLREYVRHSSINRSEIWTPLKATAGMAIFVLLLQGWSIGQRGPAHYYGRAEYDQFNYVITAQFLMEHQPNPAIETVAGSPLLLKGLEASAQRITQSVLHAELSTLSFSDAQESYGATTLWFLLLLGLAAMGYLIAVNVGYVNAAIGGTLVTILPAVTSIQLNGFFSQTSVLWTLVALCGVLARGPCTWREALVGGSVLGFLLGAYTEFAPFGFGTAFLAVFLTVPRENRLVILGILLVVALGLNVGFLGRAGDFFVLQLTDAGDAKRLASWMPGSGTWLGLGRNFAPDSPSWVLTATGIAVALCFMVSVCSLKRPLRTRAIVLVVLPLAAVITLLLLPQLPAYAFGKLLGSTTPVLFTVILLATITSTGVLRPFFATFVFCIAGLSIWDAIASQKEIVDGTDKIERVDLVSAVHIPNDPPGKSLDSPVYLILAEDSLSAGWLYYHCRRQVCYLVNQGMSDRIYPSAWHSFRRPPAGMQNVYLAEPKGLSPLPNYEPYPAISVIGGKRYNQGVVEMWKSEGEMMTFKIDFIQPRSARLRWFCFQLNAEPNNSFDVMVDTPNGTGVVSAGPQWAVPTRMDAEHYELKLRSKTGQPFALTFFGLEPVDQTLGLPYRFELVQLASREASR